MGSHQIDAKRRSVFFPFLQKARELGVKGGEFEPFSALTVTVPGAAAAWEDTVKMYGKLTLKEVQHIAHSSSSQHVITFMLQATC